MEIICEVFKLPQDLRNLTGTSLRGTRGPHRNTIQLEFVVWAASSKPVGMSRELCCWNVPGTLFLCLMHNFVKEFFHIATNESAPARPTMTSDQGRGTAGRGRKGSRASGGSNRGGRKASRGS